MLFFFLSVFYVNVASAQEVEAVYFRPKEIKKGCGLKKEDNLQDIQYIYIPSTNQLYGQYSFSKLSPEEMKSKRTEVKDSKKKRKSKDSDSKKNKDNSDSKEGTESTSEKEDIPDRDAYQTGFWTVMNDGPNPKHEKRQYAMIYGDFMNNTITAYTYDGSQIKDSYEHENYIGSFEKPFHVYDNGDVRTVAFLIDIGGLKKAYTNKDWVGMGIGGDGAGTWFHNSFGTEFTYGDKQSPLLNAVNTKESGDGSGKSKSISESKKKSKKESGDNNDNNGKSFKALTDSGIEVEAETPDDQPAPKSGERYVTAEAYSKGGKVKAFKEGSSVEKGESADASGGAVSGGRQYKVTKEGIDSTSQSGGSSSESDSEGSSGSSGGAGSAYSLVSSDGGASGGKLVVPKGGKSLSKGTIVKVPEAGIKAGQSIALTGQEFSVGTKLYAPADKDLTGGSTLRVDQQTGADEGGDSGERLANDVKYALKTESSGASNATLVAPKGGKAIKTGVRITVPEGGVKAGQSIGLTGQEFSVGTKLYADAAQDLKAGTVLIVEKEAGGSASSSGKDATVGGKVRILLEGVPGKVYLEFNKGAKLPLAGTVVKVPESGLKPNQPVPVSGEGIPEGSVLIYIPESSEKPMILVKPLKGDQLPKGAVIIIPDATSGTPGTKGANAGDTGGRKLSGGDGLTGEHPSYIPLPLGDKSVPMTGGQALLKYKYSEQGPWIDTDTEKPEPTQLIMMDLTNPSAPTLGEMSAYADPPPSNGASPSGDQKQGFTKGGLATAVPLEGGAKTEDSMKIGSSASPAAADLPHTPIDGNKPRGNPAKDPDKVWSWCSLQEKIAANPKLGPMAVQGIGIKGPKDGFIDVNTVNLNCLSSFVLEIAADPEVDSIAIETDEERVELKESGKKAGSKIFTMSNADSQSKQLFHYGKNEFSIFVKIDGEETEVQHVVDIPSP